MILRLSTLICAILIAANCAADPGSGNERKAVLAGLSKKFGNRKIVSWKINILNISGDWAFTDVTPLDKAGHPLAEQKVAVLHHVRSNGRDRGWKELDLSKVPADPNEEEYGPGFQRNIRKTFRSCQRKSSLSAEVRVRSAAGCESSADPRRPVSRLAFLNS
jgi:hypothetical protein